VFYYFFNMLVLVSLKAAGDSISPDEQKVSGKEGVSVKLRCTYETSSENVRLYWYRHHLNQAPQFILYKGARSWSSEHISDRRYQSTTSRTSTELTVTQLTLADTALYYCALENTRHCGCTCQCSTVYSLGPAFLIPR
uniref:Ig-like domain-containing protein n=1 Tax=Gadus morhua TaxID=8049 RepID=A0A8C5B2U8_GADMO